MHEAHELRNGAENCWAAERAPWQDTVWEQQQPQRELSVLCQVQSMAEVAAGDPTGPAPAVLRGVSPGYRPPDTSWPAFRRSASCSLFFPQFLFYLQSDKIVVAYNSLTTTETAKTHKLSHFILTTALAVETFIYR